MATGYTWSKAQQLTKLYYVTPCCIECAYYEGSYCVSYYYPTDYCYTYYLDWMGRHQGEAGGTHFSPMVRIINP